MTSAKISGMVSTPGTLDTGLSKVTGTVEKGYVQLHRQALLL